MLKRHSIGSFLLLAFGSTWLVAGIGAAMGIRASSGMPYMVLAAMCMLMPALAAVVQHRFIDGAPWGALGLQLQRVRWGRLALTALVAAAIVPLVLGVAHALGDVAGIGAFGHASLGQDRLRAGMQEVAAATGQVLPATALEKVATVPGVVVLLVGLLGAAFAACTANLPFMLGEELGWRGYLYDRTGGWSVQRRVLFTGVVWGIWHAPLILMGHNYPGHPYVGVVLMVVFCTLLAYLFDWSRTRANSVWGPCVLHGMINGSAGLFALFAWGGHPLVNTPVGVAGFIALAVLCLCVWLLDGHGRRAAVPRV